MKRRPGSCLFLARGEHAEAPLSVLAKTEGPGKVPQAGWEADTLAIADARQTMFGRVQYQGGPIAMIEQNDQRDVVSRDLSESDRATAALLPLTGSGSRISCRVSGCAEICPCRRIRRLPGKIGRCASRPKRDSRFSRPLSYL